MPPKNRGRGRSKGRGRGRGKSPTQRNAAVSGRFDSDWPAPRVPDDKLIVIDECDETMESPLTKFVNITGAEESTAKSYLMMCEDNLNEAIALFCQYSESENPGPGPAANTSTAVSSGRAENSDASCVIPPEVLSPDTYQKTHGIRAPLPRTKARLVDGPDNIKYNGKRKLPDSIFDEDYNPSNPSKKTKKLQELFKSPLDITFKGSFDQAKQQAKQSNKLLLVNIQDTKNFDSHLINRDLWRETRVREILRHFTLWQINKESPDADWFSRFYEVNSLPYIAILDSNTGNFLRDVTTTSNTEFITTVGNFLDSYIPNYDDDDDDDDEMSTAIVSSLSQQENGVVPSQLSPIPNSAPTSSRSQEAEDQVLENSEASLRTWTECDYTPQLVSGDATTHILIRCLDGERRSVAFSQSQPIKELFDYLSSHGMDPTELEIVSAFPRMLLNTLDSNISFKAANLAPSATIFIQYN